MEEVLEIVSGDQGAQEQMRKVIELYEKTVHEHKAEVVDQKTRFKAIRDKLMEELTSINDKADETITLCDNIDNKLEYCNVVFKGLGENIAALEQSKEQHLKALAATTSNRKIITQHGNEQMKKARDDLENIREKNSEEVLQLVAALKFTEVSVHTLENALEKKLIENYMLLDKFERLYLMVHNLDRETLDSIDI
ncbi:uncharacterized protein LOC124368491 [Homalodisca vitripennis]|uniref:uncharacterized protein LOC124368491 n=1 Tax=Homalodisca vitripennis TaxID=197043 RepID=UPI001EEB291F|nr:uncharacterized protein LOC124368491 [Homalodisca vitripennis]